MLECFQMFNTEQCKEEYVCVLSNEYTNDAHKIASMITAGIFEIVQSIDIMHIFDTT